MTWIKYPRGGFGIGRRRHVRLCRLDVIATHREREREREQTKMIDDDDGNDISCMYVCVHVWVCVRFSQCGCSRYSSSSSWSSSLLEAAQSFIQRDVGITHIHQQSMIHDPIHDP